MTLDPVHDILVDLPVFTEKGDRIGTVKEVRDRVFKVDVSLHLDFWLSRDCVLSYTAERVTVAFDKDQLSEHKIEAPATE